MNIALGIRSRLRAAVAALLALTVVMTLVVADTASAQNLSAERAERLATQLLNRQLRDRERDLTEARISVGERVNSRTFRFAYDDLNREGVVCVGIIEVRRTGNTFRARFIDSNCERPGDEALGFRAAARAAGVEFVRRERSLLRSLTRFTESAQPCETLDVPADRQDEAALLLTAGLVEATTRPLRGMLENYATTLQSLGVTDTQLGKGAAAWRDFADAARSVPRLRPSFCSVLAEWAANGYSDATAPVDFAALRTLVARMQADGREVRRTARYLAAEGIDPITATVFALDDLIGATTTTELSTSAARALVRKLAR